MHLASCLHFLSPACFVIPACWNRSLPEGQILAWREARPRQSCWAALILLSGLASSCAQSSPEVISSTQEIAARQHIGGPVRELAPLEPPTGSGKLAKCNSAQMQWRSCLVMLGWRACRLTAISDLASGAWFGVSIDFDYWNISSYQEDTGLQPVIYNVFVQIPLSPQNQTYLNTVLYQACSHGRFLSVQL